MLIYLLVDIHRNLALKERFGQQPEAVMIEYGLTPAERITLQDGNLVTLHRALSAEIQSIVNGLLTDRARPLWPGTISLQIDDVQPTQVATDTETEVTIRLSWDRPVEQSEIQKQEILVAFDAGNRLINAHGVRFELTSATTGVLHTSVRLPMAGLFAVIVRLVGTGVKAGTDMIVSARSR
jgi:hypothetical protein